MMTPFGSPACCQHSIICQAMADDELAGLTMTGFPQTTAADAAVKQVGAKQYITFRATAVDLGIERVPLGKDSKEYCFFLAVDTEERIVEQSEHNNKEAFSIVIVTEKTTTPSFGLSAWGIVLSGLLAAAGVSLRRREEDEA